MSSSSEEEFLPCHGSNTSLDLERPEFKGPTSSIPSTSSRRTSRNEYLSDERHPRHMYASDSELSSTATSNGNLSLSPENDAQMAMVGIEVLLNDGFSKAMEYFEKHKNTSPLMNSGYSFVNFMHAAISMDEIKLQEALSSLEDTQKMCEMNTGFFRSIKSAFKLRPTTETPEDVTLYEKYQRQIIIADCQLYQASLIISIHQDIPGFIRGGWMLRKSQKLFDKVRRELQEIKQTKNGQEPFRDTNANTHLQVPSYPLHHSTSDSALETIGSTTLSPAETQRLLAASSFGYGLLQVCVSMLPPKIMRVISFLGFDGDRIIGLEAMEYASYSNDMKAPMAMLGLFWFHTIIRQVFSVDGFEEGIVKAEEIIKRFEGRFGNAPMFLYFKGRVYLLKREIESAIECYNRAQSSGQVEVNLLCTYEIGWASLLHCDWSEGLRCYCEMKDQPRWATTLYVYLAALCNGALGHYDQAQLLLRDVEKVKCRRGNPNDLFIVKRANKVITYQELCDIDYIVLIMEIVCLWNSLVTTPLSAMERILEACYNVKNKNMTHMATFIEACIFKEVKDADQARKRFEDLMSKKNSKKSKIELYVIAHAYFELGTMLAEDPKTVQEGKELLLYVKDKMKDYELENRLHIRLHAAVEQIKATGLFTK